MEQTETEYLIKGTQMEDRDAHSDLLRTLEDIKKTWVR